MESSQMTISLLTMGYVRILGEDELQEILTWVDQVPITKEKKNLARDFSDGVTMAEIIKYFLPKHVELHQFSPANGTFTKQQNWAHLNRAVLAKIGLELHSDVIHALAQCQPWVIENVLIAVRDKIQDSSQTPSSGRTAVDSHRVGDYNLPPKRSDMIHNSYDKQQQDIIEKQEQMIKMLSAKVTKLEQNIRLRDKRIEYLSNRLTALDRAQADPLPQSLQNSKMTTPAASRNLSSQRK